MSLGEKLERFRKSGIKDIGRAATFYTSFDGVAKDTRVVWIQGANGTKRLHYQSQELGINISNYALKNDGHAEFGSTSSGMPYRGPTLKPVPEEFADVAVARSEQIWGPTPTINDATHVPRQQGNEPSARSPKQPAPTPVADKSPSTRPPSKNVEPNFDTLPDAFKNIPVK